jgi:hypothetical protein
MGLTWAAGWALVGLLIGVTSKLLPGLPWWDSFFEVFDAPLPALAVPGVVAGALFSIVLGIAGRRRRFSDLSLPWFTALGAVGGLLVSLVPGAMVAVGLATPGPGIDMARLTATISGPLILLSAASACVTLVVARRAEDRALLEAGQDGIQVGLTESQARELLGAAAEPSPLIQARAPERVHRRDPASGSSDA